MKATKDMRNDIRRRAYAKKNRTLGTREYPAALVPKFFYRAENAEHVGPYTYLAKKGHYEKEKMMGLYEGGNHFGPNDDDLLAKTWKNLVNNDTYSMYRFGFVSLESLYAWFNEPAHINWLKDNGFRVAMYRITGKCLEGKLQAICREDDIAFVSYLTKEEGGL